MPEVNAVSEFKAYSFKDLKIYSSTEWLADNRKKYRQVFEESRVKYIYVDLILVNKLFDRETWELEAEIKCYKYDKGKNLVTTLNVKKQVKKQDHVFHIREGWGHKKAGSFWKKGKYSWEVYINGEKVTTKYFYVENITTYPKLSHPELALKVDELYYYEGSYDQTDQNNPKIISKQFDVKTTRYVFVELSINNRLLDRTWFAEVFIRFYNDSRELKGEVIRLEKIKRGERLVVINAGWGSNVKGSWRPGRYDVEVIFQDRLIAQSHFTISYTKVEGSNPIIFPEALQELETNFITSEVKEKTAMKDLYSLIGLKNIKRQIQNHTKYIQFLQLRKERGFNEEDRLNLHSIFFGNPGTGKTTVARKLGAIYSQIGLLKTGHVHEVSRVDLVGEYIGQTAPKVMAAIDRARGGVLFIDEAYSLSRNNDDTKDFGKEVIELLIKEMTHPDCDFMVVAAGYPEQMNTLIESNPGLASRFAFTYEFTDYSFDELIEIMNYFCERKEVELTLRAREVFQKIILDAYRDKGQNFGNARFVDNLLDRAKVNMGIRVIGYRDTDITEDDLSKIKLEDVLPLSSKPAQERTVADINIDSADLKSALDDLNRLIGLENIKNTIYELVEVVQHKIATGAPVTNAFNFHTILTGNPGTGKTTVTRVCARIFRALGLIERGHIIETDRQGLVAGYVGQTALKTKGVIDDAMGGVLFIDEAYALTKKNSSNDFGDEAIQTLLKRMEDDRGAFYLFAAGYPQLMDSFLSMNPGLKSRFDLFLHFDDYDHDQLLEIAESFMNDDGLRISSDGRALLYDHIQHVVRRKEKDFGNARWIRGIVKEIIHNQNLRISKESGSYSDHYYRLIKGIDVSKTIANQSKQYSFKRDTIGF